MVYRQSHIENKIRNEVKSVLPWVDYVTLTSPVKKSPFQKTAFFLELKRNCKIHLVSFVQSVVGKKLCIEDDKAVLYQLSPETRSLLSWLVSQDLLATWNFGRPLPGVPSVKTMYLFPEPIATPGGGYYPPTGANGIGAGATYEQAAHSALGEFIERNASSAYWWENPALYQKNFSQSSIQINPALFIKLSDKQYKDNSSLESYSVDQQIYWAPAVELGAGKKVNIPASLVYMYFRHEHKGEPFFDEVSSNGAATYSGYKEACVRAILELVERDVFVRFWYHREVAREIKLETLTQIFPELQELLDALSVDETVAVYEIPNSFGIPTFIATLTNRDKSKTAFNITAASDLNSDQALHKVIREIIRFAEEQYPVRKGSPLIADFTSYSDLNDFANSLSNRRRLWAHQEMLSHIEWLADSPEVTYENISKGVTEDFSAMQRYEWLRNYCSKHNVRIYLSDVTNSVAKYAGLYVVRAVSPDLLSIFFKEEYQPLGSKRFTHDSNDQKVTLNPVPHPFI